MSAAVIRQRRVIDAYLDRPSTWRGTGADPRPVIATWLTDWTAMLDRSAQFWRCRCVQNTDSPSCAAATIFAIRCCRVEGRLAAFTHTGPVCVARV